MLNRFLKEETGAVTIEVAIIVAILVGLALAYKSKLADLWDATSDGMDTMEDKIRNG